MKEQGIIIYCDGTYELFGKHVYTDQPEYFTAPSHQESFEKEIKDGFNFRLSGLEYDIEKTLYENAINLSKEGIIWIFNNQLTSENDPELLSYVPTSPTDEQIHTIETALKEKLKLIKINTIAEYLSDDLEERIMYESFEDYIEQKKSIRK